VTTFPLAISAKSWRRSKLVSLPSLADRAKQVHAQGARTDAGLDDSSPRKDVAFDNYLRGILGVNNGSASWHRQHKIG